MFLPQSQWYFAVFHYVDASEHEGQISKNCNDFFGNWFSIGFGDPQFSEPGSQAANWWRPSSTCAVSNFESMRWTGSLANPFQGILATKVQME